MKMTMRLGNVMLLGAALGCAPLPAQVPAAPASPPAPAGYARFLAFFKPLIGTWPVRIVDRDANGAVEYQTMQLRDFRLAAGGRFVRETAIVRDSGGRQIEAGFHLFGYDNVADRVLLHGFWGNSADRFVFVSGRIEGEGPGAVLRGAMTVTHPDGRRVETRSEMKWEGAERFVWRTSGRRADGTHFPDEELVYTIAPVEVLQAR